MIRFDPRFHPRGRAGKFEEALGKVAPGDVLRTPDGQIAKHTGQSGKSVLQSGEERPWSLFRVGGHEFPMTAASAAKAMMNTSARSDHPQSLGGTKTYTSYAHFADKERKTARQLEQIRKSRLGMIQPR